MSVKPEPQHIGDGVYVSFDGFHVNIAVNHHLNHVVSLEPSVLRSLDDYRRSVDLEHGVDRYAPRSAT
jgi:hypothetical protein